MNLHRLIVAAACFVATLLAGPAYGQPAEARPAQHAQGNGDRDLLTETLEQNKQLQRLLEETRHDLSELRQEVSQLRASIASLQKAETATARAEVVPASNAPGEDVSERLMRVEDQVEINSSQIREQAQTKVESDSRFKIRLFGTVLFNTYFNTHDTAEEAVPAFAPPGTARVPNGGDNFGATLRQTSFGFAMTGPKVGDARLGADVDFDFYGGTPGVYGTDVLGALRMRTAVARLEGKRTSLVVGMMSPMISPLNPNSLAAVYYPALGDSGNLWQWLPQATVEHRLPITESGALVLQGGLIVPSGDNFYGKALTGRPGYESRLAFARRLDSDRRFELGVGGYIHPQEFGFARRVNSYAVTGDWVIPIYGHLEVRGEAYSGQSITLRGPSGADVSSVFAFTGGIDDPRSSFRGVHSAGGWIQLRALATARLEFNAAYGTDDPRNRDIFAGLVRNTVWLRNRTVSLNSIYRLRSNFLLALEYRRLWTVYPDAGRTNDHVNIAVGYFF